MEAFTLELYVEAKGFDLSSIEPIDQSISTLTEVRIEFEPNVDVPAGYLLAPDSFANERGEIQIKFRTYSSGVDCFKTDLGL